MDLVKEWNPPHRLLLGPGPSMVHPRVLRAMSTPLLGHLDPEFLKLMDEIQTLLRWVFGTHNRFTLAISGTGSAAMEAAIVNLVEPGDSVIVGINGVFGTRMAAMVERCGGTAIKLEVPWGEVFAPETISRKLRECSPVKAVALVHAETSTGAYQPLEELGALCQEHEALFLVDAVTSLGGVPVKVDEWKIDACYSTTQKCLSCPPGLAPFTLSDRAVDAILKRKTPCQSWYLDCSLVSDYWNEGKRTYHHTAPISMSYALRESLRLIQEEGLEARFDRHKKNSAALLAGLGALGFTVFPQATPPLPTLACVSLPPFAQDKTTRNTLLNEYSIEIGGGLGPLAGKVWRIGLMGESSKLEHVLTLLGALEQIGAQNTQNPEFIGKALRAAGSTFPLDSGA